MAKPVAACSPTLEGTRMAGSGSSKVFRSLAREGGGPKLPYWTPLPGDRASPERSSSAAAAAAALPAGVVVDPERKWAGPSTRRLLGGLLAFRGGVKR